MHTHIKKKLEHTILIAHESHISNACQSFPQHMTIIYTTHTQYSQHMEVYKQHMPTRTDKQQHMTTHEQNYTNKYFSKDGNHINKTRSTYQQHMNNA